MKDNVSQPCLKVRTFLEGKLLKKTKELADKCIGRMGGPKSRIYLSNSYAIILIALITVDKIAGICFLKQLTKLMEKSNKTILNNQF